MKITSKELRNKWLNFYIERGHHNIGAVSLIGDGTTGVMFNVAGMQPLMPYLLGEKHPSGKTRLCNVQGCVRTIDIEEVGDASHCTFFEMMGNWSLGDYFKREKTKWSVEFLTQELGFDINKLCTTVFAGNENVEKDTEIVDYLLDAGIKKENIFFLKDNWWDLPGTVNTPCGPDNEWFYPRHDKPCSEHCDATCECGRWVEIGNDVYMQYMVKADGSVEPLKNKNVDTGFGFERLLMYVNGLDDVYSTDLYSEVIEYLSKNNVQCISYGQDKKVTRAMRIIADHMRTSVMLIGDVNGIVPSNVGAGYILRRLMRRAIRYAKFLGLGCENLCDIAGIFIDKIYNEVYPLLVEKREYIMDEITKEFNKFGKALEQGLKEFDKVLFGIEKHKEFAKNKGEVVKNEISGKSAFRLYDTFGFPLELTVELANEKGYSVDEVGFKTAFEEHQAKSKQVANGQFKSGLQDDSEKTIKYHTATHLLNAALKLVLGDNCHQAGSNITAERLRFDFPCDHKLSADEIKQLEDIVNGWILKALDVTKEEMAKTRAVEIGAEHQFIERYPDIVSVYSIGDVSKEICTGPHVQNTKTLGRFKIAKEESSSAGVRRIKAILED